MTVISDPKNTGFKLSQLLYDTRYRSITIQIIVLIVVSLSISGLIYNLIVNLNDIGRSLGFGFLQERAGYDIAQKLIEYDNNMSHGRAALVGLLNTLLVAVVGCFIATIIGVFIGVMRLSKNWLVAKLSLVYIEIFRNVPVLLWILAAIGFISEVFPRINEFRGENATASMKLFDTVALTNRGFYIPQPIFSSGATLVLLVFILSIIGLFIFGKYAKERQEKTGTILPGFWIKLGILLIPTVLAFYVMGKPVSFSYPKLAGFNFQGGINLRASLMALTLGLALYTAAFIAETVRSGIMAISKGQSEAAAALGLGYGRVMRLIILPQALRVIIPPMVSQYLNLTKNSSLAIAVGYMDLTGTLGGITMNQTGREMECLFIMMGIYLIISLSISSIMNWYNERVKLKER